MIFPLRKKQRNPLDPNQVDFNSMDESGELMETGFKIAKVGFWSFDSHRDHVTWTREIFNILECQPEELNHTLESFLPFLHEDDHELIYMANEKTRRHEEYEIEYRILTARGQEKYIREKTVRKERKGTEGPLMVGYIQDITVYYNRENYLNSLKENLTEAQRVSSMGSWKYDVAKNAFTGSDEMYRIYDTEPGGSISGFNAMLHHAHPDDRSRLKEAMENNLKGHASSVRYRILTKSSDLKYVSVKAEPVFDEQGKVAFIIGTLQDITENMRLEEKLKRNIDLINRTEALAQTGSWESNLITGETFWSVEACRIFGLPGEAGHNSVDTFKSYVHPDDMYLVDHVLNHPRKGSMELEVRIIRVDGEIAHVYEAVEYLFDSEGRAIYIYGTIKDVTEQVRYRNELKSKEKDILNINRKYDALTRESIDVFEIMDEKGVFSYVSSASERVTGYTAEEKLGRTIFSFYDPAQADILRNMLDHVLKKPQKKISRDIKYVNRLGRIRYLEFTMRNFMDDPAINGIAVNFRDVTRRVLHEKRINHISTHDPLTNLPNKRHLQKKMREFTKNKSTDYGFGLIMLDIDNEKYVRDNLGYMALEDYIKEIALKMRRFCGNEIYLCRYSENRFIMIVEKGCSTEKYNRVLKEIYNHFRDPILVGKYELEVEISCGVSIYSGESVEGELSEQSLVQQAEAALFMAKSEGKNKIKFYSSDFSILSYKQFVVRTDLKKSIVNDELRLVFQPIVSLKTNEMLGAEVLIRWEHPEWGMISPLEFIAMAEETGYITQIGKWVVRKACEYYREWLKKGYKPIKISINFSSIQLLEADFANNLVQTILEYGLSPDFLIMEITENVLIIGMDKLVEDIKKLQAHGIQIALDDFGTGYSSLSYLTSLNIDILKIDGQFIKNINIDEGSTLITRHIIRIAQDLKIKLVAERIETHEQLMFLKQLNCYTGQGYLYSPPVPPEEFEKILTKRIIHPTVAPKKVIMEERRKFFRLEFAQLLLASLSIVEIGGKKVNVGNTRVLVKNIGPGGLCFISDIRLPADKDILLQFTTELLTQEIQVHGNLVWTDEYDDNLFVYGIEFQCDENKRSELVGLLNKVQLKMRNNILFDEGSFYSGNPYVFYNKG